MSVLDATDNNPAAKRSRKPEPDRAQTDSLAHPDRFARRHIGPGADQTKAMLEQLGYPDLDALVDVAVPKSIRLDKPLRIPAGLSESEALAEIRKLASQNQVFRSFIGMGYYDCITPPVIQRNVLENPGWYTQYTPYQAEISQGRLEALLNFQTMVSDLTGMDIANASLLDEATAAAEAMTMSMRLMDGRNVFFVSETCHPQNIEVVRTRGQALGIEVAVGSHETFAFTEKVCGALVQYPDTFGAIHDYAPFVGKAHATGALVTVATDLLALTLLKPPGEFGADIAVGSAQRFGVPLGYGGPHAAFFATRDEFKRQMPGRIVGVSKDARGKPALRLALGTREQHIRREKATSNICTAQALLANMAALYACYHGPEGLKKIAMRVHKLTCLLAVHLVNRCSKVVHSAFFDTIAVRVKDDDAKSILTQAECEHINLRQIDETTVGISLDEATTVDDVWQIILAVAGGKPPLLPDVDSKKFANIRTRIPEAFSRSSKFLQHPVFNRYHSETEMLRYLKRLESRDLSLTASMIPLGSCTMKLNAAAEMFPVSWPEFARIHPFASVKQTGGYQQLFEQLETWLAEITGFAGVSLQPNAGSQGEYAGLLVIRAYHASRHESHRNVCLIPTSAHGTNPASAVMAGLRVVSVACDSSGNIDLADLRAKAEAHRKVLACLMVTYPSTHGVYEESIREICEIIHANGGQVYMDGANMNAQVGLTSPGFIGADVCHLNLHKTFCIPHGGGGPGVGPIGVGKHLVPYLPGHFVLDSPSGRVSFGDGARGARPTGSGEVTAICRQGAGALGAVAAAPWGSAGILPISWMYIAMMGADGLTEATKYAILNANYISKRLENYFPTLYRGHGGLVAHECILDLRRIVVADARRTGVPPVSISEKSQSQAGRPTYINVKTVTAEDVAKRLMDYGFHAPTLSWPVAGTLMVEPTESESRYELDRFCDAMISIHAEMVAVETGAADAKNNLLKNAPHTADQVAGDNWDHPYTREAAAFPAKNLHEFKFWPPVARVDNVFGDRNPVCSCVGMENYS